MKKHKISLITGVAGTIGSNLAKYLLNKNHIVLGFDNLSLGSKNNLNKIIKNKNFKFFKCDVSSMKELKKLKFYSKIDYLWLLAANSDIKKGYLSIDNDLNNTLMTTISSLNHFSNKLQKNGKICFSSSSAVYGNLKSELKENNQNYNPISNYGETKLISELYIENFCKKLKLNYLILRFPNVVGKPFTHGIIFDLAKKLIKNKYLNVLGNGNQKKPYVHVSELVECMHYLIKKKNKFKLYLIGPKDKGITVKQIVKTLKSNFKIEKKIIYQKQVHGWPGDVPIYSYNTSRLRKEGFTFKLSSKQAIDLAIKERNFI